MQSRFRIIAGVLPAVALVPALALAPLAACSPAKEAGVPATESAAPSAEADLDAVVKKAEEEIEKVRLTMGASRETKIEVVGAAPTGVPGLVELKLRVTREGRSAVRRLPVTPDMKFAVAGSILPLGIIPRMRVDLDNVKLTDVPVRGNADAEVTIVEYSDFQCPYCRASQPAIDQILREYEGRVKLVYKHYPLKIHDWAMDSSLLAECARVQKPELFWKLHDFYYTQSTVINQTNVFEKSREQVKDEGIDMDAFNKCYLEAEQTEAILANVDEGKTIGVRGTPAFLVNDVFMSGTLTYEITNAIILEELGEAQPGEPAGEPPAGEAPEAAPAPAEEAPPAAGS
ncbi:MAG: thioredoxin domain-containing protein [Deltaproteobacteria bacterium]|nr:thioredoxin domain-containing protein [Deltaproteobacteria bacterium]